MDWKRVDLSDRQRLTYRSGPAPIVGPLLMLLGAAAVFGSGERLVRQPEEAWFFGVLVSCGMLALGASLLTAREVLIDPAAGRLVRSVRWLFWRKSTSHDLAGFQSVGWQSRRTGRDSTGYLVTLDGPQREPLPLFELIIMDDARALAGEVAAFLGWECDHWDDALIAAAMQRTAGGYGGLAAMARAVVGRRPMRPVETASPGRLVFRQSFETLLQGFGAVALPLGLLPLAAGLFGVPIRMAGQAEWWVPLLLGGVFTLLGVLFLLGRRGITFDSADRTVALWWGLPVPLWLRRHDLSQFTSVTLEPVVRESGGGAAVVWQVALTREEGDKLPVFRSPVEDEAHTVAGRIAEFLEWEDRWDRVTES